MSMHVTVYGKDVTPEECLESEWTTAISKRKPGKFDTTRRVPHPRRRRHQETASRLLRLPREHFRIILRPRGGMYVRRISQIKMTKALAMEAQLAPSETEGDIVCPDVVKDIFVLRDMIVQPRNPKDLQLKRIKCTTTIIVLFYGLKGPNYVMCRANTPRCAPYRRQTDVCYACGRLGHRADVCPAPEKTICWGCGTASPTEDHECSPKCALCGGPDLTADKACKQRFQVPYVVHCRRRQQKRAEETPAPQGTAKCQGHDPSVPKASSRGRSATPAGRRSRSSGRCRSRGRSRSSVRIEETTWADRVKQKPPKATKGSPPKQSNPRIAHLEQENAQLRAALEDLRTKFEFFRRSCSSAPTRFAKKRALAAPVERERDLEVFKSP
ncbi:hypothetical protein HPB52_005461 [Rhipicephalus sanguineus]|uniref:CCHC-type domain-containing protein n=1 Tax=Rhipicephalus sanguineus TaxID=34632 RepID=A0A9D4T7M7_RHISA|nr:hypothetical protein HPB52_005461 [Rhipicephalus sanguineus]